MSARRCSVCDTNWPNGSDYEQCPRGHGDTWIDTQAEPSMTWVKAAEIRTRHREFLTFYNNWVRNRDEIIAAIEEQLKLVPSLP